MEETISDPALSAAITLARLAAETRCTQVVLLDVRQRSPVTKFFLIATGTSARQMRTVAEELSRTGEALGFKPWRTSGYESAKWILVDFVDVVAHIFDEPSRLYYDLELLWGDCPKVQWRDQSQPELPQKSGHPQDERTDDALSDVQEQLSYSFEFWEEKAEETFAEDPTKAVEQLASGGTDETDEAAEEDATPVELAEPVTETLEVIEIREAPRKVPSLASKANAKPVKVKAKSIVKAKAVKAKAKPVAIKKVVAGKARAAVKMKARPVAKAKAKSTAKTKTKVKAKKSRPVAKKLIKVSKAVKPVKAAKKTMLKKGVAKKIVKKVAAKKGRSRSR